MEFTAFSNEFNNSNIYNTLNCDNTTTFSKEEILFNGIYRDVIGFDDDREQIKQDLNKKLVPENKNCRDHPSKEFILSGGLKIIVNDKIGKIKAENKLNQIDFSLMEKDY